MAAGLSITMHFLRRTRNEAAVEVLVTALDSTYPPIRLAALEILAGRRETAGHEAIVERARQLDSAELAVLRRARHRMHGTLAREVNADDATIAEHACRLVVALGDYTLLGPVVTAAERDNNPNASRVAATIVRLAAMLEAEAQAPATRKPRQDPFFARRLMIQELNRSLDRFGQHQRHEMIEALLIVVPHDHEALLKLLNPNHPAHRATLESLHTSTSASAMRLLSDFLHDRQAPRVVLELVARRVDRPFLEFILHSIGTPASLRVLRNVEQLGYIAWLQQQRDILLQLDGQSQAAAIELAMASSIPAIDVFPLLADLLRFGAPEGRVASCTALAEFHHHEANQLIRQALDDANVQVRAAAARQVRRRGLFDLQPKLLAMLDAQEPQLRQAAGEAMGDYTFQMYRSHFLEMGEDERQSLGRLVGRSDPVAAEQLTRELTSPSPSRREQAIEMARAMDLVPALAEPLMRLLADDHADVTLRVAAAEALAEGDVLAARSTLQSAARDANPSVREAARHALTSLASAMEPSPGGICR